MKSITKVMVALAMIAGSSQVMATAWDSTSSTAVDALNTANAARDAASQNHTDITLLDQNIKNLAQCNGDYANSAACQNSGGSNVDLSNYVTKDEANTFVEEQAAVDSTQDDSIAALKTQADVNGQINSQNSAKLAILDSKVTGAVGDALEARDNSRSALAKVEAIDTNIAGVQTGVNENAAAISQEVDDRTAADQALSDRLVTETKARDQGDVDTLKSANSYTDYVMEQEVSERTQGDAETLESATSYTDATVKGEAISREQGDADTLNDANLYTDNAVQNAKDEAQAYIDQGLETEAQARIDGDKAAVTEANNYTDATVQQAKDEAQAYIDESVTAEAKDRKAADESLATDIKNNGTAIAKESDDRQAADVELDGKITSNKAAIENETEARVQGDADTLMSAQQFAKVQDQLTLQSANEHSDEALGSFAAKQAKIDQGQDIRISSNTRRIGALESRMDNAEHDIKALKGMTAANAAMANIVMPRYYTGNLAVGVGVGHYDGYNALALGAIYDNGDNWAVKTSLGGSDADNWSNLVFASSITFGF